MKKVLIIGATSGIGRGLAELYTQKGWVVGATGRRELLLDELRAMGSNVHTKAFDVLADDAINHTQELIDAMGGIDMAIYCSGVAGVNPGLQWDVEHSVLSVNVTAFTRLANYFYAYFAAKGGGQLATIGSMAGVRGIDVSPAYSASKAYMAIYCEALRRKAVKEGCKGVKVTTIVPGFIDTDLVDKNGTVFWMIDVPTAVKKIYKGLKRKSRVLYVPQRWKSVAILAKLLPAYIQERV